MKRSLPSSFWEITRLAFAASAAGLLCAQATAPGTKNDSLRDIAPPVPPAFLETMEPADWFWMIGGVGLLTMALWLTWLFFFRKHALPAAPPPDPREVARARLVELRQRAGELSPRDFGAEASGVLRQFIRRRYGISTMRRTSEEFLAAITRDRVFSPLEGDLLGRFLTQCDVLKFANLASSETEALRLIDDALAFVEQAPAPQVPPPLPKP